MREDETIHSGGEQKTQRVAFLQEARKKSTPAHRNGFHGERGADTPLTAHADSVEQPQKEKNFVAGREAGQDLDERVVQDIGNQRDAAAVAVGEQAEEDRA